MHWLGRRQGQRQTVQRMGESGRKDEWWRRKQWWIGVGVVLVLLLVIAADLVAAVALPPRYAAGIHTATTADRLKAESDSRSAILSLLTPMVALAAALAGLLNYLNFLESRRQNVASLEVTRRGQVTERFTNAINQLGETSKLDVRLGGIYALEQIAGDSPDLHWPVVEILAAFIREHTKAGADAQPASGQPEPDQQRMSSRMVAADIQAALTVLGRRNSASDRGRVDLHRGQPSGRGPLRSHIG